MPEILIWFSSNTSPLVKAGDAGDPDRDLGGTKVKFMVETQVKTMVVLSLFPRVCLWFNISFESVSLPFL